MKFRTIGDRVIGRMIDGFGEKVSAGGIITQEKDGDAKSIRPRWFEVTHVGPGNEDFAVGEYVLVEHGRWTRGFKANPTDDYKLYMLDLEKILCASDSLPEE